MVNNHAANGAEVIGSKIPGMLLFIAFFMGALAQTNKAPLEFPSSCSPISQREFIKGLVKLHNSAYDEAAIFFRAAEADPDCAIAYWGEAMSFNHPFWNDVDITAGRNVLLRLAPTSSARAIKLKTARERDYMKAIDDFYDENDKDKRDFNFLIAMKKLAADYPIDFEAKAFYALAILQTIRPGQPDATLRESAATLAQAVLQRYPDHPGGLHYLIHADDDPAHAHLALAAARHYERVADDNFHALHMPSHIYVQLGMWVDAERSNQAALAASQRYAEKNHLGPEKAFDAHSLVWLQYVQLQRGEYARARGVIGQVLKEADLAGNMRGHMTGEAAELAATYSAETGDWAVLNPFSPSKTTAKLIFAQGLSALQRGDVNAAKERSLTLDALETAKRNSRMNVDAALAAIESKQLQAKIAVAERRVADAEKLAAEAADDDSKLAIPSPLEQGGVIKPAREFFGEILLEIHKPAQAAAQFSASLRRMPARAASLRGLARAYASESNYEKASQAYRDLLNVWSQADPTIPALQEAHTYLQAHP